MLRRWLKPLIVMTPKSLLRHPKVVSDLQEFENGPFQRIIPDPNVPGADSVSRILLCSGKIYYELAERREKLGRSDVAIIRMEQLYPFPADQLRTILASFPEGTPVAWVQEEPENMGACYFLDQRFRHGVLGSFPLTTISRAPSASPATGSAAVHRREQEEILARAFETTSECLDSKEDRGERFQPEEVKQA
jgi:2-oxoglutarate dehydrogenase E1 component